MIERPKPVWNFHDFTAFLPTAGYIRDYVAYATKCTDAHPLYHIISASAVATTAVSSHLDLYHHDEMHPLHMFFLIVGLSSESRKTSSIKRAVRVADPVLNQFSQTGSRVWWPQVSSPEGIIEELSAEPTRLMCLSEWTDMHRLASQGGYWKHANEFWNNVYDATDVHRVKAKGVAISVKRPRVTILGASTPSLIEDATTRVDWLAGKLARYLIAPAERPDHAEMDAASDVPGDVDILRHKLDHLGRPVPGRDRVVLSDEAWDMMRQWRKDDYWKDLRARSPEHLTPSFGRAQEHVFRLAAVYQASATFPWGLTVSPENMQAAIRVVEWCYDAMCKTFATAHDVDRSGITKVLAILSAEGSKGVTRSILLRRAKLTSKHMDEVVRTLTDRGEIVAVPYTSNGRQGVRYTHRRPDSE